MKKLLIPDEEKICIDCGKINKETLDPLILTASTATSLTSSFHCASNNSVTEGQSSEYDAQSVRSSIDAENSSDDIDRQSTRSEDLEDYSSTSDTPYDINNSAQNNELSQLRENRISSVFTGEASQVASGKRHLARELKRAESLQKCKPTALAVQESFCDVHSEKLSGKYYLKLTTDYKLQFKRAKLVSSRTF